MRKKILHKPTNYEKYPVELKKVVDFLMEARNKYPDAKLDCNGEITYANGNDGTDFDWVCNNKLCEFGWGVENGSVWAFKCDVCSDGEAIIYCYPHGEPRPVETLKKDVLSAAEAEKLYRLMMRSCDAKGVYDTTLDRIIWSE